MTTDLVAADVTNPHGGTTTMTGRTREVWGAREVGLYRVQLTASAPAGGFSFDPQAYGFQGVVASVTIVKHLLLANVATFGPLSFTYDYVNKKIVPVDAASSYDDATGDDLHLVALDVTVTSE